jgi:hypothetical protein
MVEEMFKSLALIGGTIAFVVPSVAAFVNQSRLVRTDGDHFVIRVDGKRFEFDVDSFDASDVQRIDAAMRAVEETTAAHS